MSRMSYLVNDAFTFQNYVNGVFDGILIAEVALDRLLHDGGQSALVNNYTSVSISCYPCFQSHLRPKYSYLTKMIAYALTFVFTVEIFRFLHLSSKHFLEFLQVRSS